MHLSVVRVYERGLKLTARELRNAVGDVRIHVVQTPDGRAVRQAIYMSLTRQALPPLFEHGLDQFFAGKEGS